VELVGAHCCGASRHSGIVEKLSRLSDIVVELVGAHCYGASRHSGIVAKLSRFSDIVELVGAQTLFWSQ
jgi:hypothetical protein